jgi:hypothetical protein
MRFSDLRLTLGGPFLNSLILQYVSQYRCQDPIRQKKAICYSLAITRNTPNGDREKSSGQARLCLDRNSGEAVFLSVPDPGCLSRIPDPDFYPFRIPDPGSRIPDPKTVTKDRGGKNVLSNLFL